MKTKIFANDDFFIAYLRFKKLLIKRIIIIKSVLESKNYIKHC